MFYFAYGSNLNYLQMKKRCPDAEKIGSHLLEKHRLLFRSHDGKKGYLTIVEDKNFDVPIGIYKISKKDEENLDKYEGVKCRCYRKEQITINYKGENIKGLVYLMNNGKPLMPNDDYYLKVKDGYECFGFDYKYLFDAYNECKLKMEKLL